MPTLNKPKKKQNYHKSERSSQAAAIYNTPQWKNLRAAYFMQHPLCEKCLERDIVKATEEIHHIKPILTGNSELEMKDLAYNPQNLMALCKDCHHQIHNIMRK